MDRNVLSSIRTLAQNTELQNAQIPNIIKKFKKKTLITKYQNIFGTEESSTSRNQQNSHQSSSNKLNNNIPSSKNPPGNQMNQFNSKVYGNYNQNQKDSVEDHLHLDLPTSESYIETPILTNPQTENVTPANYRNTSHYFANYGNKNFTARASDLSSKNKNEMTQYEFDVIKIDYQSQKPGEQAVFDVNVLIFNFIHKYRKFHQSIKGKLPILEFLTFSLQIFPKNSKKKTTCTKKAAKHFGNPQNTKKNHFCT
jgi:hypothetical protein